MAGIRVTISDTTGEATHNAELPHDVPMRRLLPALLSVLNRPILGADGQPISYRLYHDGREVLQDESLAQAGVGESATLILSQEAQAGVAA